jgi:asparagine synthase (glutamine-hydrolysing)
MCGIVGFNWNNRPLVEDMLPCISQRGPDDSGTFIDESVSFGHHRLAILDLSDAGHQPMFTDDDQYGIVYNGEIYNYPELKEQLADRGYLFRSETDTEVILYAYREWGADCLDRFRGMFAFAILDREADELFLARDHAGIKPLYYYHEGDQFVFGSTISAVLQHDIETEPNDTLIHDFLLYNITDHTDETFFENVRVFPSGHYATVDLDDGQPSFTQWWSTRFTGDFDGTYEEARDTLRAKLIESTNRRLLSDVPVGTCLSGGIDSSSIACMIDESEQEVIETFSAVFPDHPLDESEYIDTVSRETGMQNHKTAPTGGDLSARLSEFVRNLEEPVPSPSPFAQYMVFELAKEHETTVLLDGQGADELFAGYELFHGPHIRGLVQQGSFGEAARELGTLVQQPGSATRLKSVVGTTLVPEGLGRWYFRRQSNISADLYEAEKDESSYFEQYVSLESLHDALAFQIEHTLEHLLKWEDRNSMAHGRESRVPFLDIDVMEFVFQLPEEYLISDGETKSILRDAMAGITPDDVLNRQDKIGFAPPEDQWLQADGIQSLLQEWFLQERPSCHEYIDLEATRSMVRSAVSDTSEDTEGASNPVSDTRTIWRSLFLEAWFREFAPHFDR